MGFNNNGQQGQGQPLGELVTVGAVYMNKSGNGKSFKLDPRISLEATPRFRVFQNTKFDPNIETSVVEWVKCDADFLNQNCNGLGDIMLAEADAKRQQRSQGQGQRRPQPQQRQQTRQAPRPAYSNTQRPAPRSPQDGGDGAPF